MTKPSRDAAAISLVMANLMPIVGVLFFDWDVGHLLVLYWAENVVAGFFYALRSLLRPVSHPLFLLGRLFDAAFFCAHYGGFCAVHGVFVLAMVALPQADFDLLRADPLGVQVALLRDAGRIVPPLLLSLARTLAWPLAALVVSHGISFVQNYLGAGERERMTARQAATSPYGRMVALHVALAACGIPVLLLRSPLPLLVLLVAGKTVLDLHLHRRTHARLAASAVEAEPMVAPAEMHEEE